MEEYPVMEAGDPSAEEVLHQRLQESQQREAEAKRERDMAERDREAMEKVVNTRLREEIARECELAMMRLAHAGFPGGALLPIVVSYAPARRWFGRRFYVQITHERACWELNTRNNNLAGMFLGSNGILYRLSENPNGYKGRFGTPLHGVHRTEPSDRNETWWLEALLDALQHLPES